MWDAQSKLICCVSILSLSVCVVVGQRGVRAVDICEISAGSCCILLAVESFHVSLRPSWVGVTGSLDLSRESGVETRFI